MIGACHLKSAISILVSFDRKKPVVIDTFLDEQFFQKLGWIAIEATVVMLGTEVAP
jgi:hypothetical protein